VSIGINGAWLTTNRSCNNNCSWCYASKAKNRDKYMCFEKSKKCVDNLKELGVSSVVLIGGEPTLYPNLFELASYITSKDMRVSLATNGRKFADESFAVKAKEAGIKTVNISIKALNEEEYIKFTGNGGFEEMILGYHNLIKAGCFPILSYVITSNDISRIEILLNLLKIKNMNKIIFQFVKPTVTEEDDNKDLMRLDEMGEMCEKLYNLLEKYPDIEYKLEVSFPLCLINKEILNRLRDNNRITTCCHLQAGRGIVFDVDFNVLPCNHFIGFPFTDNPLSLENHNEIIRLWKSKNVKKFRKQVNCYPSKVCSKCDMWDICGGGCITRWLYEDPKEYIKRGGKNNETI